MTGVSGCGISRGRFGGPSRWLYTLYSIFFIPLVSRLSIIIFWWWLDPPIVAYEEGYFTKIPPFPETSTSEPITDPWFKGLPSEGPLGIVAWEGSPFEFTPESRIDDNLPFVSLAGVTEGLSKSRRLGTCSLGRCSQRKIPSNRVILHLMDLNSAPTGVVSTRLIRLLLSLSATVKLRSWCM